MVVWGFWRFDGLIVIEGNDGGGNSGVSLVCVLTS